MTQRELGKRVLKLRTRLGISQMELALRCERITTSYIGALELGEHNPTYETLKRLAKGLGITVEQLIRDEEPAVQYDSSMNRLIAYATELTDEDRQDLIAIAKILRKRNIKIQSGPPAV